MSNQSDFDFLKTWLTKNFGGVNIVQTDEKTYRASLRDILKFNDVYIETYTAEEPEVTGHPLLDILQSLSNDEDEYLYYRRPEKVTANGHTKEEALQNLFNTALDSALEETNHPTVGILQKLKLKPKQTREQLEECVASDKMCKLIKHDDPEHCHMSNDLIDMTFVFIDTLRMECIEPDYDDSHTHILVSDLTP